MQGIDFLAFGTPRGKRYRLDHTPIPEALRRLHLQMGKLRKEKILDIMASIKTAVSQLPQTGPANNTNTSFVPPLSEVDRSVLTNAAFEKTLFRLELEELEPDYIRSLLAGKWDPWRNAKLFSDPIIDLIIASIKKGESVLPILDQYDPYGS